MKDQAIDYFPFDVDFFDDDKIALIEGEFGCKGSYIAVRLLCKIFKTGGYFYQWGEDECLLFTRKLGAEFVPSLVQEVVKGLVRRSFFDKGVFDSFQILTSRGIQKRYFFSTKRRTSIRLRPEILLVEVPKLKNVDNFDENVCNSGKNVDNFSQSKKKKRKYNSSPSLVSPSFVGNEGEELNEKEKIIYFFFFERNWMEPGNECRRLLDFNSPPSRKSWDDLSPAKRDEYMKSWEPEPARLRKRFGPEFLSAWKQIFDNIIVHAPESIRQAALADNLRYEITDGILYLHVDEALHDYLESRANFSQYKSFFWPFATGEGASGVNYIYNKRK